MTALVEVFGLTPFRACLRDVSSGGCKIATGMPLRAEEIVLLTVPRIGELVAYVVWSDRGYCGLRFERAIDADGLVGRDPARLTAQATNPVPLMMWDPAGPPPHNR